VILSICSFIALVIGLVGAGLYATHPSQNYSNSTCSVTNSTLFSNQTCQLQCSSSGSSGYYTSSYYTGSYYTGTYYSGSSGSSSSGSVSGGGSSDGESDGESDDGGDGGGDDGGDGGGDDGDFGGDDGGDDGGGDDGDRAYSANVMKKKSENGGFAKKGFAKPTDGKKAKSHKTKDESVVFSAISYASRTVKDTVNRVGLEMGLAKRSCYPINITSFFIDLQVCYNVSAPDGSFSLVNSTLCIPHNQDAAGATSDLASHPNGSSFPCYYDPKNYRTVSQTNFSNRSYFLMLVTGIPIFGACAILAPISYFLLRKDY